MRYYNKQLVNTELFPEQNISRAVYEDPDGRYWVSVSNEGVGELDTSTGKYDCCGINIRRLAFINAIMVLSCQQFYFCGVWGKWYLLL